VLNELVTNALKHGRGPDGSCHLVIGVDRDGDAVLVSVRDHGPGMPPDAMTSASLGMQLVRSLSRQLRGRVDFDHDGGTRARLRVPLPPSTPAVRAPLPAADATDGRSAP
jgi:two-component sensor histidine kinase